MENIRDTVGKAAAYPNYEYSSLNFKGTGVRRILLFCVLIALLPTVLIILPLYLRHMRYADVLYKVSESDIIEIHNGISTIFCSGHTLNMNSTFNAFQVNKKDMATNNRKHIRLKKSMTLPDDTLEYWGFFLLKGASVQLKVCSRFEGSNLLIVKGGKKLDTCGLLNDFDEKVDAVFARGHDKVVVKFESETSTAYTEVKQTQTETDYNLNTSRHKVDGEHKRHSRDLGNIVYKGHDPNHVLDRGVNHGGNAVNYTEKNSKEKGASSFENDLLQCYGGNILLNQEFPSSKSCNRVAFFDSLSNLKMITNHEVIEDGYYYYIFYSDNDITYNNIHAMFDISKPTFQYTNMSESKKCINETKCKFDISMWSHEIVVVEIPTKNGIERNEYEMTYLVSTCEPRMGVYIIFPVSILIMILTFAYL